MAQQLKSAGDSATSGNVATTGLSSLDQARDACPDEAFFIGTSAEVLNSEAVGLQNLEAQLWAILEFVRSDRDDAAKIAEGLTRTAIAQLGEASRTVGSIAGDFERRAQRLGYSHD